MRCGMELRIALSLSSSALRNLFILKMRDKLVITLHFVELLGGRPKEVEGGQDVKVLLEAELLGHGANL